MTEGCQQCPVGRRPRCHSTPARGSAHGRPPVGARARVPGKSADITPAARTIPGPPAANRAETSLAAPQSRHPRRTSATASAPETRAPPARTAPWPPGGRDRGRPPAAPRPAPPRTSAATGSGSGWSAEPSSVRAYSSPVCTSGSSIPRCAGSTSSPSVSSGPRLICGARGCDHGRRRTKPRARAGGGGAGGAAAAPATARGPMPSRARAHRRRPARISPDQPCARLGPRGAEPSPPAPRPAPRAVRRAGGRRRGLRHPRPRAGAVGPRRRR